MDPILVFIRRPIFTTMLILAVVVFGLFAYPRIGVDQFPEAFPTVVRSVARTDIWVVAFCPMSQYGMPPIIN